MKIAVYAIAKDEEKFVERCVKSAAEADLFVMTDTGSTDRTVQAARDLGAMVHEMSLRPFRFDVARNVSLGMIPGDVDVCLCLDVDEVLEDGWRDEVEYLWKPGTTRMRYLFDWGQGTFSNDKIHARHGYYWKFPCHERLVADARCPESIVESTRLLMRHLPDPTKSRGQYLDLLRVGAAEDPYCSRSSFYLTREYLFRKIWHEVVKEGLRYLSLSSAIWPAERAVVMGFLGLAYETLGDFAESIRWYRKGVIEEPARREPWVMLSDACHRRKLWPECLSAALTALTIRDFRHAWPNDEVAWGEKPDDLAALAAHYMGFHTLAVQHGQRALSFKPDDPRLIANYGFYVKGLEASQSVASPACPA